MKYKNYFYQLSLILLMGLTYAACNNSEDYHALSEESPKVDKSGQFIYEMDLNCSLPDFEGNDLTRSVSYTWANNSTLYLRFKNGSSYVTVTATYNSSSDKWTVRSSSSLNITSNATNCEVYYFEDEGNVTNSTVSMTELTACYYTTVATYKHPTSSSISVTATLLPKTWRIRFKGSSNTQIKLIGDETSISYYSGFDRSSGTFTKGRKDVSLTVNGSYTPYVYGEFVNSGSNAISLTNSNYTNYKFKRNFNASDLTGGKSGYFNIPTGSSYSGWERTEVQPQEELIYKEPYTVWGASKNQTKSYMSGYSLYQEDDNRLVYLGNYLEVMTIYDFESSKLVTSTVVIETSVTTKAKIDKQLKDNYYSYVSEESGTSLYVSQDAKTVVFMWENTEVSAYYVQYIDFEWLKNQNSTDILFEEPYIVWGASRSTVKSAVANRGYTLIGESEQASDDYFLAYNGKYQEDYSLYYFDSSQKLGEADIVFTSGVTVDNVRNYLSSEMSYVFKGTNSAQNNFFYLSPDSKSYAIVLSGTFSNGTNYTAVAFVSYDSVTTGAPMMERQSIVSNPKVFDTFKWNVEKTPFTFGKRTLFEERLRNAKRSIKF